MLIVISGLPGTGKSTVAEALARELGATHLSIDVVEESMLGAGLPRDWTTGVAAYEVVGAAAELNLRNGQQVVVDAVNDSEPARQTWRLAARRAEAELRFVVLVCADAGEHRGRLEGRDRGLPNVGELTWAEVEQRAAGMEPWTDEITVVDTAAPQAEVLDQVRRALRP